MTINTKLAALLKKLEAAEAAVAKIKADIAAIDKPVPVKGDEVSFVFGRGDNKVTYTGTALKVSAGENGVAYVTVLVEIDDEPTTKRVPVKDVTIIATAHISAEGSLVVPGLGVAGDPLAEEPAGASPVEEAGAALANHGFNVDALLSE